MRDPPASSNVPTIDVSNALTSNNASPRTMRLLERNEVGKISLTSFDDDKVPPYAILSHRWDREEVLLKDMMNGTAESKRGYHKIRFCAEQAWLDGLRYCWVDTCCTNQSSSAELSESINRMYRGYQSADRCYVYLTDILKDEYGEWFKYPEEANRERPRWFTRGWSLQELLASRDVIFYDSDWERLGNRTEPSNAIHAFTNVPISALIERDVRSYSKRECMSWIEGKNTKKPEDLAYSMLGIFNVSLVVNYGEGAKSAFRRLKQAIDTYEEDDRASRLPVHLSTSSIVPSHTREIHISLRMVPIY